MRMKEEYMDRKLCSETIADIEADRCNLKRQVDALKAENARLRDNLSERSRLIVDLCGRIVHLESRILSIAEKD